MRNGNFEFDEAFRGNSVSASPQETESSAPSGGVRDALSAFAREALVVAVALPVSIIASVFGAQPGTGYWAVRSLIAEDSDQPPRSRANSPSP